MKSSSIRKMHRAISSDKSRRKLDKFKIAEMQERVEIKYNWYYFPKHHNLYNRSK